MKDDNKVKEFEDKVLRGMHLEDAIQTIRDYMEANPDLTGAEILQSFQYNSNDEHNSVEWFLSQLVSGQISMEDMRKLSFPDDIISYIQALLDGLKEGILPSPDSDPLPTNPHTENRGRHVRPKGLKYSKVGYKVMDHSIEGETRRGCPFCLTISRERKKPAQRKPATMNRIPRPRMAKTIHLHQRVVPVWESKPSIQLILQKASDAFYLVL